MGVDEFLGQASIPLKVRFDCVAGEKDKYEYDLHFDISTRLLKINYLQDQDIYASPRTQWLPLMCKPGQQKNGYRFDAILILSFIVIILNQLIQRRIGAHPRQSSRPFLCNLFVHLHNFFIHQEKNGSQSHQHSHPFTHPNQASSFQRVFPFHSLHPSPKLFLKRHHRGELEVKLGFTVRAQPRDQEGSLTSLSRLDLFTI